MGDEAFRKPVTPLQAVVVVTIVVAVGVYAGTREDRPSAPAAPTASPEQQATDEIVGAWSMAQQCVKKGLKAPSTADFGGILSGDYQDPDTHVERLGPKRYRAHGYVDAQNGFGAMLRMNFTVEFEHVEGDTWSCGVPTIVER